MSTSSAGDGQSPDGSSPQAPHPGSSGAQLAGGIVAMLVGFALLFGGFVLWVFEKGHQPFLFPWAGRLTMVVGIVALGGGWDATALPTGDQLRSPDLQDPAKTVNVAQPPAK